MQQSIDLRLTQPQGFKEQQFQRAMNIVEQKLQQAYPNAIIRVRKSTSVSGLSVFGLGKDGNEKVGAFLEELFNDNYLFEE